MRHLSARGVGAAVLVLLVAAVCIRLGFWQLDRLAERRARNAAISAAMAAPPIDLDAESAAAIEAAPTRFEYRRVRAAGTYDETGTFLLRGRGRRGSPGVHVVTPLRLRGADLAVLVDRGWLPAPDATTADPRPYRQRGLVRLEGIIHLPPPPAGDGGRPLNIRLDDTAIPTYQRIDLTALDAASPLSLLPVYVARAAGDTGAADPPLAAPPPPLDDGPHLGYAVQWFGFAAIAAIGFAVVALRPRRPT